MKAFSQQQERDVQGRDFEWGLALLLKLALPSNPNLLCIVRGAVSRLTEVLGFSAVEGRSVTRAVDEALANIVRHSYRGREDRPIVIYFRQVQRRSNQGLVEGLEVLLCDRGPAVDPAKLRGRKLQEIRPGGLGLHFIRQAMDIVEFTRVGRTNRLRADFRSARGQNHDIRRVGRHRPGKLPGGAQDPLARNP
jgi:serine/threonine-protein kinase RsbW